MTFVFIGINTNGVANKYWVLGTAYRDSVCLLLWPPKAKSEDCFALHFHYLVQVLSYSDLFLPTHCRCRGLLLHLITLNDKNSVGLLWTSDRPVPCDNTQHSQETDIYAPGGCRNRNPSKQGAADLRERAYRQRPHYS
jgi:hypothetical protein